ncbi:RNA polymerase II transcription factor B 73 kDa subunit [Scheffersomyces stipitis CBS 6054]|uniref:RNA polymerase II transcription factor B 73 kDa subunit n=1 Tax=Scheffersomyces stipitis (strain ATCC 58785 / CBS 6054 / NBRC 10063 / NRRL Y-11545) TaxID=322104 RepID=A3LYN7_PICST|nr:RNA polymerase II transcription factor B 73 kDa subunit [Scheffersomyces stipitis CBS 6054]ABN68205.2 RNA polymerase II transcription factor B 73 kDa subunit [Scheffersomyces stipitis CBS 6054]
MRLRLLYKNDGEDEKSLLLNFSNRPTMNNIKDALQTIVARSRTVIKDTPTPATTVSDGNETTPGAITPTSTPTPSSVGASSSASTNGAGSLSFNTPESLSDASLLRNFQLQQQYLKEDRNLRSIFTSSVIDNKLTPQLFWSTRLNQLRTYALTISQHRGPYNVLSTIKPVATSDNQVNVNVTRDTINEIFDTYPIIRRAFTELVPSKFSEGEFWSRFFNSKLFRRLRGDKINNSTNRGDVILDKYLYIDQTQKANEDKESATTSLDQTSKEPQSEQTSTAPSLQNPQIKVNKFLDLLGNEEDNSQKLGNRPDLTMRFEDDGIKKVNLGQENEMIVLMKNMNKLSSKMVEMSNAISTTQQSLTQPDEPDSLSQAEINEYQEELNLHDLNEVEESEFIRLSINSNLDAKSSLRRGSEAQMNHFTPDELSSFFSSNKFKPLVNLSDTYDSKNADIEKSSNEVTSLIKHNFRTFKLTTKDSHGVSYDDVKNLVDESLVQEIIRYNMTVVEFLSHFWKLFLNGNNPTQLKRLFASLKNCRNDLTALKERATKKFDEMELVKNNEKLREKIIRSLQSCLEPMEVSLDMACNEYVAAVRLAQKQQPQETESVEINDNGKRPLQQ